MDADAIIPYFDELINGDSADALKSIKALADAGNLFASYVLGSFFLFGATPRFYDFNTAYELGVVKKNARIEPSETFGISCFLRLLKIKEGDIPLYQLEGIFDLYKIISGDAAFFSSNDIQCRPKDGLGQLGPLFKNGPSIKNLLVKLDHHEIYLDEAKSLLAEFEVSADNLLLDKAISYLESILNEREIYKFSMHDISYANLMMARLYAAGAGHLKTNMVEAVRHYEEARLDEGYQELIGHMKQKGDRYKKFIKKYIGLVKSRDLKIKLFEENGFVVPDVPDVSEALRRLVKTKPASSSDLNFSFEFEIPAIKEGMTESVPENVAEENKEPELVDSELSAEEIAKVVEKTRKEAEMLEDLDLTDEVETEGEVESQDDVSPEDEDPEADLKDEFAYVEEYPEFDESEPSFEDD